MMLRNIQRARIINPPLLSRVSMPPPPLLLSLLLLLLDPGSAYTLAAHRGVGCAHPAVHTRAGQLLAREIQPIASTEDYEKLLREAEEADRLVVIKFYASWCRACKAMAPKFVRVAEDWPEIEFHEILFDNNKKLCKSLGIKILPYMEIVDGSRGKVDGFTCGPSKVSLLVSKLEDLTAAHADGTIDGTDVSALLHDAD